jgi:CRISPR-associated protein Cas6
LPLAGQGLEIARHRLRLGVPSVRALVPAARLAARLVTVKGFTEPAPFLEALGRQLRSLGIEAHAGIPQFETGPRAGEPRRRVVRIQGRRVVGFAVLLEGLTAAGSLDLQEHGLGGRRKLGCGFFAPVRGAEP